MFFFFSQKNIQYLIKNSLRARLVPIVPAKLCRGERKLRVSCSAFDLGYSAGDAGGDGANRSVREVFLFPRDEAAECGQEGSVRRIYLKIRKPLLEFCGERDKR